MTKNYDTSPIKNVIAQMSSVMIILNQEIKLRVSGNVKIIVPIKIQIYDSNHHDIVVICGRYE